MSYVARRSLSTSATLWKGRRAYYNKHTTVKDPALQDPEYFDKAADSLPLDGNYLDSLKNLWSQKVGTERDLMMKASDKLIGRGSGDYALPDVDVSQPRMEYRNVEILKDAASSVQKVFSLDFGLRSDLSAAWKKAMVDKVKLDQYDQSSLQAKIAFTTVLIRHWTALADELMERSSKKPTWLTTRIFLALGYRRKLLRLLREQDINAFEELLHSLQISYQVDKPPEHVKTRKAWSEHKLRQRVEAEKEARLEQLRESFEQTRKSRVPEINNEIEMLEKREHEIRTRRAEIDGDSMQVSGVYHTQLIQELSEVTMHNQLLYCDKPSTPA